jgi:hypothetical protein
VILFTNCERVAFNSGLGATVTAAVYNSPALRSIEMSSAVSGRLPA